MCVHVVALGPVEGCTTSIAWPTGVHNIRNYVVLGEHCGGSSVAARVIGSSAVLPGPVARNQASGGGWSQGYVDLGASCRFLCNDRGWLQVHT